MACVRAQWGPNSGFGVRIGSLVKEYTDHAATLSFSPTMYPLNLKRYDSKIAFRLVVLVRWPQICLGTEFVSLLVLM